MDLLTRADLMELVDAGEQPSVSLYLSTHRSAPETKQDPIRFKNSLRRAQNALRQRDLDRRAVDAIIDPAEAWLEEGEFWRHQSDGLAVFLAPQSQRRFRLPRAFEEQVHVRDHFYVNPLLPLLQANGRFYVLAVSQNVCRLFVGDRDTLHEIHTQSLPDDLQSALGWRRERELNLHSMQRKPQSRGGDDTAMYHGHFEDMTKEELAAYFRRIDSAVIGLLQADRSPLVFAGVEYLFPIYRSVNSYPELCRQCITGNPDNAAAEDLRDPAWEVVRPQFEERERSLLDDYKQRESQGMATDQLGSILVASRDGLVESLLIAAGTRQAGRFDRQTGRVQLMSQPDGDPTAATEDLIDCAVVQTLATAGDVLMIDPGSMPASTGCLALLRAPLSTVASQAPA